MNDFTVIGLNDNQVARGALRVISDFVTNAFETSVQLVTQTRNPRLKQHWATIRFENPLDYNHQPAYQADEVLYVNPEAMRLISDCRVQFVFLDINVSPLNNSGIMLNIPIWR